MRKLKLEKAVVVGGIVVIVIFYVRLIVARLHGFAFDIVAILSVLLAYLIVVLAKELLAERRLVSRERRVRFFPQLLFAVIAIGLTVAFPKGLSFHALIGFLVAIILVDKVTLRILRPPESGEREAKKSQETRQQE